MPLERRKDSKWWYGRYQIGNKRLCTNLRVRVRGTPPASLRDEGDPTFERSRGEAKTKLDGIIAKARNQESAETLVQELHHLRYGVRIESFPIAQLVDAWRRMPKRRRSVNPRYAKDVEATLNRFIAHVKETNPEVVEAAQVDRRLALSFMASEDDRGVASKTWNDSLKRVRATFRFLQTDYGLLRNPFDGIKMREENHVHRMPLTADEIQRLLKAAEEDDFCRPLLVCGLSTAMRLGDCCLLRWTDVDTEGETPSITVKTAKTGEVVCIPMSEPLRREIARAQATRKEDAEQVWPEQAELYRHAHQLVTRKVRRVFKRAGFGEDDLRSKREHGMKKASLRDFHSLRTTWITEALSRGVAIETVKRISGHKTVEVVTSHYFHPDREQVRMALQATLPKMLGPGSMLSERDTQILGILDAMTAKSWRKDRKAIRDIIAPDSPATSASPTRPA